MFQHHTNKIKTPTPNHHQKEEREKKIDEEKRKKKQQIAVSIMLRIDASVKKKTHTLIQ